MPVQSVSLMNLQGIGGKCSVKGRGCIVMQNTFSGVLLHKALLYLTRF